MTRRCLFVVAVAGAAALLAGGSPSGAQDWPQWRGPARDGFAALPTPQAWPETLDRQWRVEVGEGHSGPVVAGDRVYVHSRRKDLETVSCLTLDTGRLLWRQTNPAPYEMNSAARGHGKGPKSTPVVADGRLFTLGITGILSCFAADTGQLLWRWDSSGRFPVTAPLYGTAASPLVVDGLVIAHLGGPGDGAIVALDAADGGERWRWDGDGPGYTSPVLVPVGGGRQLVTQTERFCLGLDPASGRQLWRLPFTTPYDQNIVTPVAGGPDTVVFSGLEQGTTAWRIVAEGGRWAPRTAWHNPQAWLYMSSPVVADGRLYGLTRRDRGRLFCLDLATGRALWQGPPGLGDNVVFLDTGAAILLLTTEARLIAMARGGAEYRSLAEYQVADTATWAHPAVADGRLLIKDATHLTSWRWPAAPGDGPSKRPAAR